MRFFGLDAAHGLDDVGGVGQRFGGDDRVAFAECHNGRFEGLVGVQIERIQLAVDVLDAVGNRLTTFAERGGNVKQPDDEGLLFPQRVAQFEGDAVDRPFDAAGVLRAAGRLHRGQHLGLILLDDLVRHRHPDIQGLVDLGLDRLLSVTAHGRGRHRLRHRHRIDRPFRSFLVDRGSIEHDVVDLDIVEGAVD